LSKMRRSLIKRLYKRGELWWKIGKKFQNIKVDI
jgi:hypothetical protein